jgi:hypothetical protein
VKTYKLTQQLTNSTHSKSNHCQTNHHQELQQDQQLFPFLTCDGFLSARKLPACKRSREEGS